MATDCLLRNMMCYQWRIRWEKQDVFGLGLFNEHAYLEEICGKQLLFGFVDFPAMDTPNAVNTDAVLTPVLRCNAVGFQVECRSDTLFVQTFIMSHLELKSKYTQLPACQCRAYKTDCFLNELYIFETLYKQILM